MFDSINIDATVKHVKNIVDNVRCAVCDKVNGTRVRYACGHTSCKDCAEVAVDCYLCETPQGAFQDPVIDKPYTRRIEKAVNLLNVFQDEFHIDVYKRQRLSEQLKVEKELFPECIQAPVKYINKRKSLQNSIRKKKGNNKENKLSHLPGEEISSLWDHKMEQSNVEQWLHKYVRKPFAILNTNDQNLRYDSSVKKSHQIATDPENIPVYTSTRKRPYIKTALSKIENKSTKKLKKADVRKNIKASPITTKNCVNDFFDDMDESGIVLDEEEQAVIIDDSQSVKVDKDQAALLAIHEAENKKHDSVSLFSSKSKELMPEINLQNVKENKTALTFKVPFYLKSYLSEKCKDCMGIEKKSKTQTIEQNKDVSITIDNKSFTTTIKVMRIEDIKNIKFEKKSVEVQTEEINDNKKSYNSCSDIHDEECANIKSPIPYSKQNSDYFKGDIQHEEVKLMVNKRINTTQNIIIEESDSDEELDASISMSVTAEIHRSCEEADYGILADVDNLEEHNKKARRAARGYTPTSTDSSEKENFNPNRMKKSNSKKKLMKK